MAYTVERDEGDAEARQMPLEVEAEDGQRVPVTAKSWYGWFARAVFADREDARECFRKLIKAGCERHYLTYCLYALAGPAPALARADLAKAADQITKAGWTVFKIALSAHANEVDRDGRFRDLHKVLGQYARQLSRIAPQASRRKPLAHDATLATIAAHVKVRTNAYHDDEVATLVEAVRQFAVRASSWDAQTVPASTVEAVTYSAEGHVRWRRRHRVLVAAKVEAEKRRKIAVHSKAGPRIGLCSPGRRQRYIPTALAAARELYADRGWHPP